GNSSLFSCLNVILISDLEFFLPYVSLQGRSRGIPTRRIQCISPIFHHARNSHTWLSKSPAQIRARCVRRPRPFDHLAIADTRDIWVGVVCIPLLHESLHYQQDLCV